jgi:uncharacterized membrane protein
MNQTHIHLLITHLPIFGSILGGIVLLLGILCKNTGTRSAAYVLLIIAAIGATISYLTGESAEHTVKNIQGIAKDAVEEHEESALLSLIMLIASGVLSLGGLLLNKYGKDRSGGFAILVLLVSLVGFGIIARTGYLGGMIRHTEISSPPTSGSADELDD